MAKNPFDKLPQEFLDNAVNFTVDEVKAEIVRLAAYTEETRKAKEADEKLAEAKAVATELGAPYKETLGILKLKTRYLCQMLEDKGKA